MQKGALEGRTDINGVFVKTFFELPVELQEIAYFLVRLYAHEPATVAKPQMDVREKVNNG